MRWRHAVVRQAIAGQQTGLGSAWWLAVSASVAAHALLLIGASAPVAGDTVPAAFQALPPLQWRVLVAQNAPAESARDVVEMAESQRPLAVAPNTETGPTPPASGELGMPERAASLATVAAVQGLPEQLPAVPVSTEPTVVANAEGYVLRKALTQAPVPIPDLRLAWPPGSTTLGRQQAVFSVFIDEEGVVRRVVADAPTLSPPVEAAARESFMATRFEPGQVDGRPVKSLIRIEVVYDQAVPVAAAASAPSGLPAIVSRQNL